MAVGYGRRGTRTVVAAVMCDDLAPINKKSRVSPKRHISANSAVDSEANISLLISAIFYLFRPIVAVDSENCILSCSFRQTINLFWGMTPSLIMPTRCKLGGGDRRGLMIYTTVGMDRNVL